MAVGRGAICAIPLTSFRSPQDEKLRNRLHIKEENVYQYANRKAGETAQWRRRLVGGDPGAQPYP
jgi:hypothetical protein